MSDALEAIRREKSTAKVSQRAEVALLALRGPAEWIEALRNGESDLQDAGTVQSFTYETAEEISVDVTLVS